MSVAVEKVSVQELTIDVEADCGFSPDCRRLVESDYVDSFYSAPEHPLSVATLPDTDRGYEDACASVARYNARQARKLGYIHQIIDRADWTEAIYEIRSSSPWRQGRAMPDAYMERQEYSSEAPPTDQCPRHLVAVHGVVSEDGRLVAYAQMVQCGEVVRFNTILGHWDHLCDQVVWLLVMELVKWHINECGAAYALYYTHDSGHGVGLRYFKERFRFRPSTVKWDLG